MHRGTVQRRIPTQECETPSEDAPRKANRAPRIGRMAEVADGRRLRCGAARFNRAFSERRAAGRSPSPAPAGRNSIRVFEKRFWNGPAFGAAVRRGAQIVSTFGANTGGCDLSEQRQTGQ